MSLPPGVLARGPWEPADVSVTWSDEPYAPPQEATAQADQVLAGKDASEGVPFDLAGMFDFSGKRDGKLYLNPGTGQKQK